MTHLDSILKSRDVTLPTKVHLVKLWFFHPRTLGEQRGSAFDVLSLMQSDLARFQFRKTIQ